MLALVNASTCDNVDQLATRYNLQALRDHCESLRHRTAAVPIRLKARVGSDHQIEIFDATDGRCLQTLGSHMLDVTCLHSLGHNKLDSASRDQVWKLSYLVFFYIVLIVFDYVANCPFRPFRFGTSTRVHFYAR